MAQVRIKQRRINPDRMNTNRMDQLITYISRTIAARMDNINMHQVRMGQARMCRVRINPFKLDQGKIRPAKTNPARKHSVMLNPVSLLLFLCLLPFSTATIPNDNAFSLKDLSDIILSKLDDMNYKISSIEGKIRRMDDTIENDMKMKVSAIEEKVSKIETEVTGCGQSYFQSQNLEGPINDLMEDIKDIKQDRVSFNTAISGLTLSTSLVASKMDNINNEITQGISSIKMPVEQLKLVTNATLKDIKVITQESSSELKHELESLNTQYKNIILVTNATLKDIKEITQESSSELLLQGNKTLNKIKVVENEVILSNELTRNISRKSDLIPAQLEDVKTSLKDELALLTQIIRKQVDQIPCAHPWVYMDELGCLLFAQEKAVWDTARAKCNREAGSDLAILDTPSKIQTVTKHIESTTGDAGNSRWIGGNSRSGQWMWLDGQPIYEGWRPGQPDQGTSGNICLYLDSGELYDDNLCDANHRFICQK